MKKLFTHFMALIACLCVSMNANAQFSATIEDYPTSDWSWKGHDFSLAEVATALGTDAATLVASLDAWMQEEAPTEFLYQTSDFVPTSLADYAAADRGFWMTLDGVPHLWDDKDEAGNQLVSIYNHFAWDAEAGTFTVGIGQRADALAAGAEGHASLVLAFNGKKATFDITFKVIEKPSPEIDLASLVVLSEATVNLPQYQGSSTKQEIDLTGIAAMIGTTDEDLAANLGSYLYTSAMELRGETEESQKPYLNGKVTNETSANGIGFWLASVWDDENEAFSQQTARCIWGTHAAFRTMFAEQFSYDAATHKLSFTTGFENANLELGTKTIFDLYLVKGVMAYHITNIMTMTEKPYVDPSEFTEVGSEDVDAEFDYLGGTYELGTISIDLDAVLTLLECEAADIKSYALSDAEGNMSDDYDVANDGFWFNAEGYVCKWASGYFFAGPTAQYGWGEWIVGQHPDKQENAANPVYTTKIFLVNGNKYFTINLKVTIKAEDQGETVPIDQWESVATWNVSTQTEVRGDHEIVNDQSIDLDELESLIGTSRPKLYALALTESGTEFTKDYTCTPYPGFWTSDDGYRTVYTGGDPKVGYCYGADGTFDFYQIPNGHQDGFVWKGKCFLVNESNGKYVTINLTVIFGEAANVEEVASIDINVPVDNTDIDVDFTEALAAMELESAGDLLGTNLRAILEDGQWSELMPTMEGAGIKANGGMDVSATLSESIVFIYPNVGSNPNTMTLTIEEGSVAFEGQPVKSKLAFDYEYEEGKFKRILLNLTIMDKETYDGVKAIDVATGDAKAYDLAGRRADMSRKGIYILNGKKVVK